VFQQQTAEILYKARQNWPDVRKSP
jgi:hypothetical protein